jgi:hypothetical protein
MRILLAATVAAFFTAGSVAAHAETAKLVASKTVKCSKRAEAECTAPDCTWTPGTGSAKGKCTKAKKKK